MAQYTQGLQWRVLAVLLIVALASALVATLVGSQTWDGALLNLGTEMAGAVVTYVLLQLVIGGRARKEDLIADMGSNVNDVAVHAANELRRHGWLTDGSLSGANLIGANLRGAKLWEANLSGATLVGADLSGAKLWEANLIGANLIAANLSDADLSGAKISPGLLEQGVSLKGAIMPNGTKHE